MEQQILKTTLNSSSPFKFLTISDIHLGNRKNPTKRIVKNLDDYFDNYSPDSKFAKLDAIFIAGDLFDKLLDLESDDYYEILCWLVRLLHFCRSNDIILRILLGTPSHDRHQPKVAPILFEACGKDFDFDYVSTLKIERLKKSGLYILYVPDEYHPSVDETLRQVKELLVQNHISQVDIAIMHGMFTYQAPVINDKLPLHSESEYLSIVKHFINIGHVHNFSVFERIIAQGSFDRMSHGQEEAKGAIVCTIDPIKGNSFEFIENKNALIFKTVRLKSDSMEKSMEQVQKELSKIPEGSNLRIIAPKNHSIIQGIKEVKIQCLGYNIDVLTTEEEKEKEERKLIPSNLLDDTYIPITIDATNIVDLVMEHVGQKYEYNGDQILELRNILQEIKL